MTRRVAGLLTIIFGVSLAGQQPLPPTFKSNVDAVTLDVRVVDRNGQFVDGLTQDDLKIFEDGREQAITAFEQVNIPIHADERPLFTGQPVDSDVASNDGPASDAAEGRLYVLLLDDLHTSLARAADVRAQAREFVEHHFTESDRAIVLTTSGRLKVTQEFTNNRQRLLTAVAQFDSEVGSDEWARCQVTATDPARCATADDRAALHSLNAVATWLAAIVGQRKAVLFFGEGLSSDQLAMVMGPDPTDANLSTPQGDDASGDPTQSPGGVRLQQRLGKAAGAYQAILPDLLEAAASAARANVTVYPLDPRRHPESSFTQIVTDTSSYYLLGYVPTNAKHDGTFRKLEVRAVRPGLKVQARTGYTAKTDAPPKRTSPADLSPALTQLMATPVQISGLSMRVAAPSFAGNGSKASVEVIIDVAGRDLTAASDVAGKGSLDLLIAVADAAGHVEATERGSLAMQFSATTREEVAQHGLRVLSRLAVAPGRYLLRIAGVDGGGTSRGSVQYDLDVPDFSQGSLTMSGLALASAAELGRPTTGSDRAWPERFAQPPTTTRVFSEGDDILVSGEIYRNDRHLDAIETTTTVRSASGEVVFQREETLTDGTAGQRSTLRLQTMISLQGMDAGDYLLTVDATATSSPTDTKSRQIPFTVR